MQENEAASGVVVGVCSCTDQGLMMSCPSCPTRDPHPRNVADRWITVAKNGADSFFLQLLMCPIHSIFSEPFSVNPFLPVALLGSPVRRTFQFQPRFQPWSALISGGSSCSGYKTSEMIRSQNESVSPFILEFECLSKSNAAAFPLSDFTTDFMIG